MSDWQADATKGLLCLTRGHARAADQLVPLVYDTLRRIAAKPMRREGPQPTLQPTALVHEAYGRLIDRNPMDWKGKSRFRAMAREISLVLGVSERTVGDDWRFAGAGSDRELSRWGGSPE